MRDRDETVVGNIKVEGDGKIHATRILFTDDEGEFIAIYNWANVQSLRLVEDGGDEKP